MIDYLLQIICATIIILRILSLPFKLFAAAKCVSFDLNMQHAVIEISKNLRSGDCYCSNPTLFCQAQYVETRIKKF